MRGNLISDVPNTAFDVIADSLAVLDLRENELSVITSAPFSSLARLETLMLEGLFYNIHHISLP